MQPARFPLALLAVLVISAMTPLIDAAAGKSYGSRGFAAAAQGESEREVAYQRARSTTSRIAEYQLRVLEYGANVDDPAAAPAPAQRVTLAQMRSAVRDATANLISERRASEAGLDEFEERRLRERAKAAMEVIDDAQPRGVASVFFDGERAAVKQVFNGILKLDAEMALAGALGAVFSVPAAAMRAAPLVFPLGLLVVLCALTFVAGGSCRMAAVHAGRFGRLTARESAAFSQRNALNLVAIPVLPCLVLGAMALVVVVFALLLQVPAGNILSGLLFVIPLLVALLGAILALVTIIATLLTAQNIAREKELGTLEQLNVTPITRGQFIAGKLLPFWGLALVELAIALTVGVLVFDVPVRGNPALLFGTAAVYLFVVLGIGLWISTIAHTQQQAMFVSFFIINIYLLMSGLFTPIDSMENWVQDATLLNPVRHFVTISRAILMKGAGLDEIARPLALLALFGVVALTFAVRQYHKRTA